MRACLVALAATLAIGLPEAAAVVAPQAAGATLPTFEQELVAEVNALRARRGLPRLAVSSPLRRTARAHARDMVVRGYFGHDGFARRLAGLSAAGETLAWQSGPPSASRILARWLASPSHRRVVLSPRWRLVGLGAVQGRAGGVYGGRMVTVVVADFARP